MTWAVGPRVGHEIPTIKVQYDTLFKNNLFDFTLDPFKLEFLEKNKYLGVYITSDLNWKYHINTMWNKASKILGRLETQT